MGKFQEAMLIIKTHEKRQKTPTFTFPLHGLTTKTVV